MLEKYEQLRFCKILKGTKKPFELDWTNKPYTWQEIQEHIKQQTNFGVLCGYGNLIVIDSDNQTFQEHIERYLPETYKIKTGGGGTHNYYFIEGLNKKIILYSDEVHLGEIQTFGTQVIGTGSIHPNGNLYKEINNQEIKTLGFDELFDVIKSFVKELDETFENAKEERKGQSDIDLLNVADIFGTSGLKYRNGEYYGIHPVHGSETGMNFWINPSKNLWHCFRCNSGGSVISAIAVKEGLIDCSNARSGYLRGEKVIEVLEIARQKYGFKKEIKQDKKEDYLLIWEKDLDKFEEHKDWIIEKLIPTKSVGVWTGKRSSFKTFLLLNAVFCIANGIDFLGLPTLKGKVIYLDKENGIYEIRKRRTLIKNGLGIKNDCDVGFICFSTLKIDNLKDIGKIEELIKIHKPILLVIDTYRRGISFEENDAGAVSALFVDILRPLVEKHEISIVLIHHDRKSQGSGDEMEQIRGSSDLTNYSDFILKNERTGEERLILKQLKNRNAPEIKPIKVGIEKNDTTYLKFLNMGELEKLTQEEKSARLITDWIINNNIKTFSTSQAKEIAFNAGIKKNNFFNGLEVLESTGIIEKALRGIYNVTSKEVVTVIKV